MEHQRELKRKLGKLLYIAIGLRRALTYRGRRVTVIADGWALKRRVLLTLVSNAQLYGAAMRIPPTAQVDDGRLDLTLLHGDNALHVAWHFIRLGAGLYQRQPDIEQFPVREVEIHGAKLPVHVDAEPVGSTPVRISIRPRALRVLVPESANRALFATMDNKRR